MNLTNCTKYFKRPQQGVVFKKDKWKYTVAQVLRDFAETLLYLLVMVSVCWLALYAFFNLD